MAGFMRGLGQGLQQAGQAIPFYYGLKRQSKQDELARQEQAIRLALAQKASERADEEFSYTKERNRRADALEAGPGPISAETASILPEQIVAQYESPIPADPYGGDPSGSAIEQILKGGGSETKFRQGMTFPQRQAKAQEDRLAGVEERLSETAGLQNELLRKQVGSFVGPEQLQKWKIDLANAYKQQGLTPDQRALQEVGDLAGRIIATVDDWDGLTPEEQDNISDQAGKAAIKIVLDARTAIGQNPEERAQSEILDDVEETLGDDPGAFWLAIQNPEEKERIMQDVLSKHGPEGMLQFWTLVNERLAPLIERTR